MSESLSIEQSRKRVLLVQRLLPTKRVGSASAATLSAMEQLGYISFANVAAQIRKTPTEALVAD